MGRTASAGAQINALEKESGYIHIDDGTHKADARQELKDAGLTDNHEIGKRVGFYESGTMDKYNGIYRQYLDNERDEGRVFGLKAFNAESADNFLAMKWDEGRSPSTILNYCKAFAKLEGMLETVAEQKGGEWQHTASVDSVLAEWRATANEALRSPQERESRAYTDAQAVVNAVEDPRAHLAASLQLETGLRVHDVTYVRLNADGTLNVNSKAGFRVPHFQIPANLAAELRQFGAANMQANGSAKFNLISYNEYRNELKAAAEKCGERWTGTHALRHSFANNMYNRLRAEGKTDMQARTELAKALFHGRISVTYYYVK